MANTSSPTRPASVGHPAPEVTFVDPAGGLVHLKELLAQSHGLPTLLVFFKTSCPTCRLAWPHLQTLHALRGKFLRVIGVAQNDAAAARAFQSELGAKFELLLDPEPSFTASNAFGVESVPHHVLVQPDGKVSHIWAGWQRAEMESLATSETPLFPDVEAVPSFKPG